MPLPVHAFHNESKLLSLIAIGDEAAFAELYERHKNRIYTIAFKLTCSATLAEEIVQDVFLAIWLKRSGLSDIQHFSAYLFVVARNQVYKVLRRTASGYHSIPIGAEEQSLMHNDTESRLMEKENELLLHVAVNRLPAQQKSVYNLIKVDGLKRGEVADLLNIQPETIKSHLAHAMKSIRSYCLLHLDMMLAIGVCLFTLRQAG